MKATTQKRIIKALQAVGCTVDSNNISNGRISKYASYDVRYDAKSVYMVVIEREVAPGHLVLDHTAEAAFHAAYAVQQ